MRSHPLMRPSMNLSVARHEKNKAYRRKLLESDTAARLQKTVKEYTKTLQEYARLNQEYKAMAANAGAKARAKAKGRPNARRQDELLRATRENWRKFTHRPLTYRPTD